MLAPGTLLQGRYRVVRLLGEGGMGAVYESVDQRFDDATVAVKQTTVHGETLLRAFRREAQLLNSLRHPALPIVTDYFVDGDDAYLVMDFVPGRDLGDALAANGRPFTPDEVAPWADQLLDALEYLHGHQPPILHRDLKPQNLKITPDGTLKVLDFGLSKGTPSQVSSAAGGTSVRAFTPHYAPLEQIRGSGTDVRSDIYAVAATLYHLLTARVPSDALERAACLYTTKTDPLEPAHRVNPQLAPALGLLIAEALGIDARLRPATAKEFRQRLHAALASGGSGTAETDLQPVSWASTPVDTMAATRIAVEVGRTVPAEAATEAAFVLPETRLAESGHVQLRDEARPALLLRRVSSPLWIAAIVLCLAAVGFLLAILVGLAVAGKLP